MSNLLLCCRVEPVDKFSTVRPEAEERLLKRSQDQKFESGRITTIQILLHLKYAQVIQNYVQRTSFRPKPTQLKICWLGLQVKLIYTQYVHASN